LKSSIQAQNLYKEEARLAKASLKVFQSQSQAGGISSFTINNLPTEGEPMRKRVRKASTFQDESSDLESEVEETEDSSRRSLDVFHSPNASPLLSPTFGFERNQGQSQNGVLEEMNTDESHPLSSQVAETSTSTSPISGKRSLRPAPIPPQLLLNLPPQLAKLKVNDISPSKQEESVNLVDVANSVTPTESKAETMLRGPFNSSRDKDDYEYAESIFSNSSLVTAEDGDFGEERGLVERSFYQDGEKEEEEEERGMLGSNQDLQRIGNVDEILNRKEEDQIDEELNLESNSFFLSDASKDESFLSSSSSFSAFPNHFKEGSTSTISKSIDQIPISTSSIPQHPLSSNRKSFKQTTTPPPPLPLFSFPSPIQESSTSIFQLFQTRSPNSSPPSSSNLAGLSDNNNLSPSRPALRERRSSLSLKKRKEKKETSLNRVDTVGSNRSKTSERINVGNSEPEWEMEPTITSNQLSTSASDESEISDRLEERGTEDQVESTEVDHTSEEYPPEKTDERDGDEQEESTPPRYNTRLPDGVSSTPTSSTSNGELIGLNGSGSNQVSPPRIAIPPRTASTLALFELISTETPPPPFQFPTFPSIQTTNRSIQNSNQTNPVGFSTPSISTSIPNLSSVFQDHQQLNTIGSQEVSDSDNCNLNRNFNRPPLAQPRQRPQSISVPPSGNHSPNPSLSSNSTRSSFYDGLGLGLGTTTRSNPFEGIRSRTPDAEMELSSQRREEPISNNLNSSSTPPVPAYRPILPFRGTSLAYLPPAEQDRTSLEDFNPPQSQSNDNNNDRPFFRSQTLGHFHSLTISNHLSRNSTSSNEVPSRNFNLSLDHHHSSLNAPPPPYAGISSSRNSTNGRGRNPGGRPSTGNNDLGARGLSFSQSIRLGQR